MKLLKFGAIDIGSNASRLFIANILEDSEDGTSVITKSSIHRIPLRLGEDVFSSGEIGELKRDKLLKTMQAFNLIMDVQQVRMYRACATSAMREAKNAVFIVDEIFKSTGIKVEIISGEEEACLMFRSRKVDELKKGINYISMDLGGGSMELTLFNLNEIIESASFKVGTIRMLNGLVDNLELEKLKNWIQNVVKQYKHVELIGSGGNINKLYKLSQVKKGKQLSYKKLKKLLAFLASFDYDDRVKVVALNSDRADVIMPAAKLFLDIMEWSGIDEISVPVVGLVDGIAAYEYAKYKEMQKGIPFDGNISFKIDEQQF